MLLHHPVDKLNVLLGKPMAGRTVSNVFDGLELCLTQRPRVARWNPPRQLRSKGVENQELRKWLLTQEYEFT